MLIKVLETIKQNNMLSHGDRVLCALSGGADSSVMLDMLIRLSDELGISVCAAHLNHKLRGRDSFADEEFARKKCQSYGIDFISEEADVLGYAKSMGQSVELAARNIRYDFLYRASSKLSATKIATAHNANDNLETILFNLSRGSGVDGICGIPHIRGNIIRPVLCLSRDEIEKYAEEKNISFCTDKTNSDTTYSRNMLRHNAIPALTYTNPAAVENAYRASCIIRQAAQFIKDEACSRQKEISVSQNVCNRQELLKTHPALLFAVCNNFAREALGNQDYSLSAQNIHDIKELADSKSPSGKISLPDGLQVRLEYERLIFEKSHKEESLLPKQLLPGENFWGGYRINIEKTEKNEKINNSLNTFFVSCDTIENGLLIRPRKTGDEIKLRGRPRKSVKKLFIDEKVPREEREKIPVISGDGKVLFIYGLGADEKAFRNNGDMFKIEINKI